MRRWRLGGLEVVVGAARQHHDLHTRVRRLPESAPEPAEAVWVALHELVVEQEHRPKPLGEAEAEERRELLPRADRQLLELASTAGRVDSLQAKVRAKRDPAVPRSSQCLETGCEAW